MLGPEFKRTLRAAQAGNEAAFIRLWRDANPAMIRYLRVVGIDDPYDGACEGWITVVRGFPGFSGDEIAWRVWLLACTRMRAEEGTLRRAWGSVTALSGARGSSRAPSDEPMDLDEMQDTDDEIRNRGINHTLAAISRLPLGQGEVIMLRLAVGLPVGAVADVVGTDPVAIRRSESRALERLAVDREMLTWSLAAPPSAAELADERVVAAAYRSIPQPGHSRTGAGTKVIAFTPIAGSRRLPGAAGGRAGRRSGLSGSGAGLSRTAMVGVVAVSASVLSLGGISAAAYVGVLPDPIQSVLHHVIGAPAPRPDPSVQRPGNGGQGQPGGPGQGGSPGVGKGSHQPSHSGTGRPTPSTHTPKHSPTGAGAGNVQPPAPPAHGAGKPAVSTSKAGKGNPKSADTAGATTDGATTAQAPAPSGSAKGGSSGSGGSAGSATKGTQPPKGSPSPKKGG